MKQHAPAEQDYQKLESQALSGSAFLLAGKLIGLLATVLATALLARILSPYDFGIVAFASIATGLITLFQDLGLASASIQKRDITDQHLSNLLWVNLLLSVFLVMLAWILSNPAETFFEMKGLAAIIAVSSLGLPLSALGSIHNAILLRRMQQKTAAYRGLVSTVTSLAIAVILALAGAGYWALVSIPLSRAATQTILIWTLVNWLPSAPKDLTKSKSLFAFGANVTSFNFINYFSRKADDAIIGFSFGTIALGFYSKAYDLLLLPIQQINSPLSNAVIPALSRLQDQPYNYRKLYETSIEGISLLSAPLIFFSTFYAHSIIELFLGSQWSDSALIYQLLSPAALMASTNVATGWVYKSWGHVGRQTLAVIPNTLLFVSAIIIGSNWGITGVAISVSTSRVLLKLPNLAFCFSGTPARVDGFLKASGRPIAASAVALVPCLAIRGLSSSTLHLHPFAELCLGGLSYFLSYLLLLQKVASKELKPLTFIATRQTSLWRAAK
ncbi:lipopolysaccharide biosynthesis protein [Pelagicoccus albus]|uniref:Lipopolysaccharide biosynthesis protein n=1 Tax=Pelagicoccus albus TaxID=415222 RepID=A0A7X1E9I9_9BACT|nr:lipopolysaccharide biosynthesis protein [Pelagicoccus albus]MBC2605827.1 lipopolysaccharide biosynthesis protein [Pelagicoccus albus]